MKTLIEYASAGWVDKGKIINIETLEDLIKLTKQEGYPLVFDAPFNEECDLSIIVYDDYME
jgi:hypothetical protein